MSQRHFWIASYPRSGNTLARVALSRILLGPSEQPRLDENFPEYVFGRQFKMYGTSFRGREGPVSFVKTHWKQPAEIDNSKMLGGFYLVRHPIDVFLSGMNYLFINSAGNESFRSYFEGSIPRRVEDLHASGQLEKYMTRFIEDRGLRPFSNISGTWIENVVGWSRAAEAGSVRVERYENFIAHLNEMMSIVLSSAGIQVPFDRFEKGIIDAKNSTKPDGGFFWRGSTDTKSEFFSASRIKEIETAVFSLLGSAVGIFTR